MKKHWLLIGLCIICLGLWGCDDEEEQVVEESTAAAMTEEAENEQALGGVSVEPSVLEKLSDNEDVDSKDVVGNGEFFIKVGDKIYFRMYEQASLSESAMGGDFRSMCIEDDEKRICYVTEGNDEINDAFNDTGFGELYYYDGKFYLRDDLGSYSINEDGSDKEYLNLGEDMASFHSVYDHYMFYTNLIDDKYAFFVKDLDTEDDGTPIFYLDMESERGWPSIKQAEVHGEYAYIGVSYVEGTGYFFQGGDIVKCPIDGSDTEGELIKEINFEDADEEEVKYVMKYFTVNDDESVDVFYHLPGSAWVEEGDLYITDEDGEEFLYVEGFERDPVGGIYEMTEQVCMLDDEIYAINNLVVRSPEDDIGWREYYKVLKSIYYVIDAEDNLSEIYTVDVEKEDMEAFVYLLQDTGDNGEYLVLCKPVITVGREDSDLCYLYGLDPDNPDMFFDDYEIVEPFYGDGYVYGLSDDFTFQIVDYESDTFSRDTDIDEFIEYIDPDETFYEKVYLDDLDFNEYTNMYSGPVDDYENDIYYSSVFARIIFNEDYSEIERIEEIYLP